MGFPVPGVTTLEPDLPMFDSHPLSSMTASVAGSRPLSLIPPSITFHYDGRARSHEDQAIGPIHNPLEMAKTHGYVVVKRGRIVAISNNSEPVLGNDVKLHARPRRSPPTKCSARSEFRLR